MDLTNVIGRGELSITKTTKAVRRESSELARYKREFRNVIVILGPGNLIGFRIKGLRTTLVTTVGACVSMAARQKAAARQAEIDAKRKAEGKSPRRYRRFV